jgi:hypothetical protein
MTRGRDSSAPGPRRDKAAAFQQRRVGVDEDRSLLPAIRLVIIALLYLLLLRRAYLLRCRPVGGVVIAFAYLLLLSGVRLLRKGLTGDVIIALLWVLRHAWRCKSGN